MRNPALVALADALAGDWDLTLTNAWFLESMDVEQHGRATVGWIGDAFVELVGRLDEDGGDESASDEPTWHFVFGRSDSNERLVAMYHDPRPTSRVFEMTFGDGTWTMLREDPDFHQRLVATVQGDRIDARFDVSDDAGVTWRKDFDLIFRRRR
jgi:hypothetical protein